MPTRKRRQFLIRQKQKRREKKQHKVSAFNKRVSDLSWAKELLLAKLEKALILAKENPSKIKQQLANKDFVGEWLALLKEYDSILTIDKKIGQKPFEKRLKEREFSAFLIHEIRAPLLQEVQEKIRALENSNIIEKTLDKRRKQMFER